LEAMMLKPIVREVQRQAKEKVMKAFAKSILFTGVLVMGANGLMAGQASDSWLDQWYRAKYGRSSPGTEARQRAEAANTAFREETAPETRQVATPGNTWLDQWYRAKYGRSSPATEARQRAETAYTAFREETAPETRQVTTPTNTWLNQWYRAKYGRPSPQEEARQKAQGR
jgi:hypothetical protein